ncbi:MAG: peptidyl-prolyl cis-trans isomerase, partial [Alphaproteobacteria bacterium]|nr:peptidyl-prolyl cis-trans isomerase [Alphaproteobacteria bacterium]
IQADELLNGVNRQMENFRRIYGNFGVEQAKQLGIVDTVLNGLIAGDLFRLEQTRLGVMIDDQVVRDAIVANPNFHNSAGAFDKNVFLGVLANNQMSESRYVALIRQEIERGILSGAVAGGATVPPGLADALFRRQNEKRVADTVFIASDKMTGIAAPSEAELQDYYDKHQDAFRAPEYRGITALTLTPDDLAPAMEVSEEKLRKEFDARQDEFQTPERREIEQILLPDETKANEAEAQIAAGKDFAEVARSVANQEESAIKVGWTTREDMLPALADVAFALAQGEVSKPVQDPLGWHILRVTGIDAGTKTFEEVRDRLKAEVARETAADELFKEHNEIEDALAGGATLDEVAEKFKMKTVRVAAVDLDGRDPKGERAGITDSEMLHAAFNTEKGQMTRLTETKDNGYFLLRVDSVTPAALKPLSEVENQVAEQWRAEQRGAAAAAMAKEIAAAVASGKSLAEAAAEKQLTVTTSPPMPRTGGGGKSELPASLVSRIFELKPGESGVSEGSGGWYVAQLKSIDVPDPGADKAALDQVSDQLTQGMESDLLSEYDKALRARYPVDLHRDAIDRAL